MDQNTINRINELARKSKGERPDTRRKRRTEKASCRIHRSNPHEYACTVR